MRKIKVLHVHTMPVVSGSGINTLLTMKGLSPDMYEVEFACAPGGKLIERVEQAGIHFHPLEHLVQPVDIRQDVAALFELKKLLKKNRFDIVHTHNSKAGFIGRLAAAMARVPIVVHTVHGFAFHDFETSFRRAMFIQLEKFAARFADKLVTVSNPLRDWGLSLGIGKEGQYVTIHDGIDLREFSCAVDSGPVREALGIAKDDIVIGATSKLWEGKGLELILEAAPDIIAEVGNVKFLFLGEGYFKPALEKIALEKGISEHVIFAGFRDDVAAVTSVYDIAVLASFFEGLGRVLLEAMAMGVPVVASDVGGIPDIVDDRVNGILVKPDDAVQLREALLELINNKQQRECYGSSGRRKIDESFSHDVMVGRIDMLYKELLAEKKII